MPMALMCPINFPLAYLFLYIPQILGSISKGCPLLEHIDLDVKGSENPLYADLIALSSLRHLSSVFIYMRVDYDPQRLTPADREDFRASLDAIVEQGLLEVRIRITTMSIN